MEWRPVPKRDIDTLLQLPDDAPVDEHEAAVVLGQGSGQTLSGWRQKGIGPAWVKLTDAHNGPVRYQMGELRRYMRERTVQTAA
jgi:hypothetical protein